MSKMIEIDLAPDPDKLRQFGWIALVGFGFVAAIAWFDLLVFSFGLGAAKPFVVGSFAGLGLLAAVFSLVAPKANRPIYLALVIVSYPIGFVLSYVIMGALFYGLITPVAIFFKLTGRDPMHRRFDPDATTYWTEPRPPRGSESYFKQY